MLLPVLLRVPGFEGLETSVSDDYLSHGHLYPKSAVPVSRFQALLAGISSGNMLAMFIWEYKHVFSLVSSLPSKLPAAQIVLPFFNHLPHT